MAKIYSAQKFPCVNDYIEDVATFTIYRLGENEFREMLMQYKAKFVVKFFSHEIYLLYGSTGTRHVLDVELIYSLYIP